ncbi:MAG: porin [Veillonellales bacterium]
MKKRLLAAAVAAMITLSTGLALANPVELDGSVSYRYRVDHNQNSEDHNAGITRFTLNAKSEIAPQLSIYARFAAEGVSNNNFTAAKDYNDSDNFLGEIDQYGFDYTNKGFEYKIGQQAAWIGGTGLLYDSTGYLGQQDFGVVDGINIKGKSGVTSLDFLAAQENNSTGDDNKIYALRGSYNPTSALTLGATYATYRKDDAQNFWAVDAAYTMGKATYSAEYAKSNADADNSAYDVGVAYKFDNKNTVSVTNYKVETNGNINAMTTFDSNRKGFYYSADHNFTKDTALHLLYRDMSVVKGAADDNTSFRATVSYNF